MQLTIVCPVNDEKVLEANLMRSKVITEHQCPVILIKNCDNVPHALNEGKMQAGTTHIAFIHQDVYLPEDWVQRTTQEITRLTINKDSNFGALGVFGRLGEKGFYGYVKDRGKIRGNKKYLPTIVDTIDEMVIITRKDIMWFDEKIPSAHLYGADICLHYRQHGLKNYVIDAYCEHNSTVGNKVPDDFKVAEDYLREKYKDCPELFPIWTTCTKIEKDKLISKVGIKNETGTNNTGSSK